MLPLLENEAVKVGEFMGMLPVRFKVFNEKGFVEFRNDIMSDLLSFGVIVVFVLFK